MEETKELTVVKTQATKALSAARDLVIESPEDMIKATDVLSKIKQVGKLIKDRKELITRPMMEALTSARDLFKPIESNHADAEKIIKDKMLSYQKEADKKAEEARAKIAERVDKGTMKPETAIAKMDTIKAPENTTKGKVGTVSFKVIKKYRVTDESKLPREFMVPDMGKITEALKAGQVVPGAESYDEKVISAR